MTTHHTNIRDALPKTTVPATLAALMPLTWVMTSPSLTPTVRRPSGDPRSGVREKGRGTVKFPEICAATFRRHVGTHIPGYSGGVR